DLGAVWWAAEPGSESISCDRDAAGSKLVVTDGRGVRVLERVVDLLGRELYARSADAGERRVLPDAHGRPVRSWEADGTMVRRRYDPQGRLTHRSEPRAGEREILTALTIHGDAEPFAEARNLTGRVYRHFDAAGVVTYDAYDRRGNPLSIRRRFARAYQ